MTTSCHDCGRGTRCTTCLIQARPNCREEVLGDVALTHDCQFPLSDQVTTVNIPCPLCNRPGQVSHRFESPNIYEGQCETCGYIYITQEAVNEAQRLGKLHILSASFRRVRSQYDVVLIKEADVATIIADTPEYSVLEKLDRTLQAIADKTPEPGAASEFTSHND